ncbi:hypothetical protein [Ralstonia phage RP13]|nr:hypothetical protein [Ralstonia phage RP13]
MLIPVLSDKLDAFIKRDIVQGKVVDNADPLNKSRVRVSIPGISDKIETDHLPWYPLLQGSSNSHTSIPPVNSRVFVRYIDIYNSIVLGSAASTTPR